MKPVLVGLKTFILLLLFSLCPGLVLGVGLPDKKIFILHSYEKGNICGEPQHQGVLAALAKQGWTEGANLTVRVFYMETKSINHDPEAMRARAAEAQERIREFHPHVLVTLDDNAFHLVGLPLSAEGQPTVFCGLNQQPEFYNSQSPFMQTRERPGGRVTGVYEKLHLKEALQVLSRIVKLKRVLMITDLSPTGKAIARQVEIETARLPQCPAMPCDLEHKVVSSWHEYQETILALNHDPGISAFYLAALALPDSRGKVRTAPEIISWTVKNSRKPAMGLNYAFIRLGLFGGASVDFHAMGRQAGQQVVHILEGVPPGSLPIEEAQRVALVFNLKRLRTLGIEVPQDILLAADEIFGRQ